VLFRTTNSRRDLWSKDAFERRYVSLAADGAQYLVELGYLLAGIDYQGIERYDSMEHPTHRTLLEHGCMILEGTDLRHVAPGVYELVCLPLRLVDGEGSPVRAILIEDGPSLEVGGPAPARA
jgi:arylformamidase